MTYDDGESYTAGAGPDPEQVARRLHDLRRVIEDLAGRPLRAWDELAPDERAVAVDLIAAVLAWLEREGTLGWPAAT